jgi:hypothetical protein
MKVLDPPIPSSASAPLARVEVEVDEAAARRSLRQQVARLERQLAAAAASAFPTPPHEAPAKLTAGPGMLTLGELEQTRDRLADRLRAARGTLASRAESHERNRRLVERMTLDPARYKFVRVTREDIGETGCGGWEVRPRLGLLGMLAGWWRVKLSSGCPLASRQLTPSARRHPGRRGALGDESPAAARATRGFLGTRRHRAGVCASVGEPSDLAGHPDRCACPLRWSGAHAEQLARSTAYIRPSLASRDEHD